MGWEVVYEVLLEVLWEMVLCRRHKWGCSTVTPPLSLYGSCSTAETGKEKEKGV